MAENVKTTILIDQAYQAICSLDVRGPAVEVVAKIMGLLRQAFAEAQKIEEENLSRTKAEEDDGK